MAQAMITLKTWPQHPRGLFAFCTFAGCNEQAYELEPGLPTLYCAAHRAAVVTQSNAERRAR